MEQVGEVLSKHVARALEEKENEIDAKIREYDAVASMADEELEEIRRKRLEQMRNAGHQESRLRDLGHGHYSELYGEKEFFEAAKASTRLVVHFYRPSTIRCEIVDKHLTAIAEKHVTLRCVKINAEKSPFLTERLRIVMLPTIMLVKDGKTEHSIIGFDEFGGVDDFPTSAVEKVLKRWEMLPSKSL